MSELIHADITQSRELLPLIEGEYNILVFLRNKKLFYIITTYLAFIGILIYAWFDAKSQWVTNYGKDDEEEMSRYVLLAPYVFTVLFAALTAFFIDYYYKLVHPYVKDVKKKLKEVIYFKPEKYKTPLFADYYILTPANKKTTVKISKELFDEIDPNSTAFITVAQHSRFVFEIEVDGRKINFNETSEPVDE